MAPAPSWSICCRECQQQRIKCGLEQPSCDRCLKPCLRCSGTSSGQLFIRRHASSVQDISNREMLNLAIRSRNNETAAQGIEYSSPLSAISPLGISIGLYRSVVEDFWVLSCDPIKNSARRAVEAGMSICAQAILPLAFQNKALDSAIFAVSTMYLGRVRGDTSLRGLALSAYPTALCRFRSELILAFDSKAEQRYQKDLVMAILLSLLLLEWLAHGPNGEGFRRHVDGALDIVKLSGPQSFQPPLARQVYTTIRTIALYEAYKTRKAMFLAADSWANIPFQGVTKTPRDTCVDITLHIPGLLERSDQIKRLVSTKGGNINDQKHADGESVQSGRYYQAVKLLRDCDSLFQRLHYWFESLNESEKRPLWWYSRNPEVGSKSQRPPSLIHFSTPKMAGLLLYYWTGLLQLSIAVREVRDIFRHDMLFAAHCEVLGADSPSMFVDMDRPSQIAVRICLTVIHLGSSLEGGTMAYVPLELAERYFINILASDWQRDWGDEDDKVQYYERAKIGLDCCKLGFETLRSAFQNYQ